MTKQERSTGLRDTQPGGAPSLPRPPGVIRQFLSRHPWWTDSIVAGICLLSMLPSFGPGSGRASLPLALTVLAVAVGVSTAAVLFRRHRPWTVLCVVWGASLIVAPYAGTLSELAVPIVLYAVAVYGSTRDAWIALAGSVLVEVIVVVLSAGFITATAVASHLSFQLIAVMFVAVLIGINVGNRKRYLAALIERAAQLARERDQQARLAAASERARIAREMHDIVSHSLTVMVALADGAVASAHGEPERSGEAMQRVAETGRQALVDMRRMLGVLNDASADEGAEPASLAPQPGVDDLAVLAEMLRELGLPVRLVTTGVPPSDSGVQLTVFRVVQESLTNALRYATEATRVTARVSYSVERIGIVIEDDGRSRTTGTEGAGRGLLGMGERIALYGGSASWGPRINGGWRVSVEFPPDGGTTVEGGPV